MNVTQIQVTALVSHKMPHTFYHQNHSYLYANKICLISDFLVSSEDFQCKSQYSNTHDNVESAEKSVIETIELLDSDSENMLKDHVDSPKIRCK